MSALELRDLYQGFRQPAVIRALAQKVAQRARLLKAPLRVMEVCGGHTHTLMKYGLPQLLPDAIEFIHGPGCPVCVMPKERIDQAIALARMENTILLTLGDMIRVPGSSSSLAKERAKGCDIRALYSPLEALKIAAENPHHQVVFFAIGFETTTPMSAALLERAQALGLTNLFLHINHVLVPPAVHGLLDDASCQVDAFIGPSHVSVISGAKIYQPLAAQYQKPVAVSGFEPVDVLQGVWMLVEQAISGRAEVDIQYSRAVSWQGNLQAQALMDRVFQPRARFRWRGLGDIADSALQLKAQYARYDAEVVFAAHLSDQPVEDHALCICGDVLKGIAKPKACKVFAKGCDPSRPLGSCMVSEEGACNAYYRYARMQGQLTESIGSGEREG
jgi:hydrogenase expression/formation protein HypD